MHLFHFLENWRYLPDSFTKSIEENTIINANIYYLANKLKHRSCDYYLSKTFESVYFYSTKNDAKFNINFSVCDYYSIPKSFDPKELSELTKQVIKENPNIEYLTTKDELIKLFNVWKSSIFFSLSETLYESCNLDIMENLKWIIIDNPTYYLFSDDSFIPNSISPNIVKSIKTNENVTGLVLKNCGLRSVGFLKNKKNLRFLNLEGNMKYILSENYDSETDNEPGHYWGITGLEPLADLPNLEKLNISNTGVKDLTPLISIKNLNELVCINTPIPEKHISEMKLKMPNCKIIS